jgi:DNA polymerase-1
VIHLYDGNNVMLRDLDKVGGERIGLRRRYDMSTNGIHIWCWDGRNHNERRRMLYPAYKMNRTPMAEDRFAQIGVFREALQHSPCYQAECDGWEADDVIGALVHRFASRKMPVTVHTNDLDYWQLMSYSNVTIDGIRVQAVPNCEPHHIPLYKALVGDPSDNIIGVKGFGPKSWNALTPPDRKKLLRAIDENSPELIHELPLPTRPRNLLLNSENRKEAKLALAVTRFIPVPEAELDAGMKQGVLNREAANALFRRFFL